MYWCSRDSPGPTLARYYIEYSRTYQTRQMSCTAKIRMKAAHLIELCFFDVNRFYLEEGSTKLN